MFKIYSLVVPSPITIPASSKGVFVHFDLKIMVVYKTLRHGKVNDFVFLKGGLHDSVLFIFASIRTAFL